MSSTKLNTWKSFFINKPIGASPGRDYVLGNEDGNTNSLVLYMVWNDT